MIPPDQLDEAAKAQGAVITRLQMRIGAEISGLDLTRPLTQDVLDLMWAAMVKHRVVFLREQPISREQHLALGRAFGPLEIHPLMENQIIDQNPHLEILPVKTKQGKLAERGGGDDLTANKWHTDMTCRPRPPMASILRAIAAPPLGGDTLWSCAVSAYEGLDADTRAQIEDLQAEHDPLHAFGQYIPDTEEGRRERVRIERDHPVQVHPVVRIHPETGERILFVNSGLTTRILGLEREQSDALLAKLWAQFERPEYQVRFRWRDNSIALWDERATQHYAVQGFEGVEERHLERVSITGDRPVGPSQARAA